jgi:hypothetical protein
MAITITDASGNTRTQLTRDDRNYSAGSNYGQPKTSTSYSSSGSSATPATSNPSPAVQSNPITNLQSGTTNNNVNVVVKDKYGYSTYNTQPDKVKGILSDNNGTLVSTLPGNATPTEINRAITGDVGRVNRGSGGGTYYSKAQFPGVASGDDSPLLVVSNSQEERAKASSLTSGQLQSGEKSVWLSPGNELIPSSGSNAPYGLSARAASDRGFKKIPANDLSFSPGKVTYNPILNNQTNASGYTSMSGEDYVKNFVKSDRGAYIDTLNQQSVSPTQVEGMRQSTWFVPNEAVNQNDIFNKYFNNTTIYGRQNKDVPGLWGSNNTTNDDRGFSSISGPGSIGKGNVLDSIGRGYMDLGQKESEWLGQVGTAAPNYFGEISKSVEQNGAINFGTSFVKSLANIPLSIASGGAKSTASFVGDMERVRTPIASKIYGNSIVSYINSGTNNILSRLDTAFKTKGELELKPEGYAGVSAIKTAYSTPLLQLWSEDKDAQAFATSAVLLPFAVASPVIGTTMKLGFGALGVGEAIKTPTPEKLGEAAFLIGAPAEAIKLFKWGVNKAQTYSAEEIPVPSIFDPKALESPNGLGSTKSIAEIQASFEATRTPDNLLVGVHSTADMAGAKSTKVPEFVNEKATEDPGVFFSAQGKGQPLFLRLGDYKSSEASEISFNPFKTNTPNVIEMTFPKLARYPQSVLKEAGGRGKSPFDTDWKPIADYQKTRVGKGEMLVTARREFGHTSENEAIVPLSSEYARSDAGANYSGVRKYIGADFKQYTTFPKSVFGRNLPKAFDTIVPIRRFNLKVESGTGESVGRFRDTGEFKSLAKMNESYGKRQVSPYKSGSGFNYSSSKVPSSLYSSSKAASSGSYYGSSLKSSLSSKSRGSSSSKLSSSLYSSLKSSSSGSSSKSSGSYSSGSYSLGSYSLGSYSSRSSSGKSLGSSYSRPFSETPSYKPFSNYKSQSGYGNEGMVFKPMGTNELNRSFSKITSLLS